MSPQRGGRVIHGLRQLLAEPLARGLDPDHASAPAVHGRIIREKVLLRDVYDEWYRALVAHVGELKPVVEVGSGAGYLATYLPGLVTTDVRPTPAARLLLGAQRLPFRPGSLGAIVMTNVMHHLPRIVEFFQQAALCIRPGGAIVAIEPWVTPWSSWVYRHLHHEPFVPDAVQWDLPAGGPLSTANGALPWIISCRDRARFEGVCPEWRLEVVAPGWPVRYLVSGGVSVRSLAPAVLRGPLRGLDRWLERWPDRWAMFALLLFRRTDRTEVS